MQLIVLLAEQYIQQADPTQPEQNGSTQPVENSTPQTQTLRRGGRNRKLTTKMQEMKEIGCQLLDTNYLSLTDPTGSGCVRPKVYESGPKPREKGKPQKDYTCGVCNKSAQTGVVLCETCNMWIHYECEQLSDADIQILRETDNTYMCSACNDDLNDDNIETLLFDDTPQSDSVGPTCRTCNTDGVLLLVDCTICGDYVHKSCEGVPDTDGQEDCFMCNACKEMTESVDSDNQANIPALSQELSTTDNSNQASIPVPNQTSIHKKLNSTEQSLPTEQGLPTQQVVESAPVVVHNKIPPKVGGTRLPTEQGLPTQQVAESAPKTGGIQQTAPKPPTVTGVHIVHRNESSGARKDIGKAATLRKQHQKLSATQVESPIIILDPDCPSATQVESPIIILDPEHSVKVNEMPVALEQNRGGQDQASQSTRGPKKTNGTEPETDESPIDASSQPVQEQLKVKEKEKTLKTKERTLKLKEDVLKKKEIEVTDTQNKLVLQQMLLEEYERKINNKDGEIRLLKMKVHTLLPEDHSHDVQTDQQGCQKKQQRCMYGQGSNVPTSREGCLNGQPKCICAHSARHIPGMEGLHLGMIQLMQQLVNNTSVQNQILQELANLRQKVDKLKAKQNPGINSVDPKQCLIGQKLERTGTSQIHCKEPCHTCPKNIPTQTLRDCSLNAKMDDLHPAAQVTTNCGVHSCVAPTTDDMNCGLHNLAVPDGNIGVHDRETLTYRQTRRLSTSRPQADKTEREPKGQPCSLPPNRCQTVDRRDKKPSSEHPETLHPDCQPYAGTELALDEVDTLPQNPQKTVSDSNMEHVVSEKTLAKTDNGIKCPRPKPAGYANTAKNQKQKSSIAGCNAATERVDMEMETGQVGPEREKTSKVWTFHTKTYISTLYKKAKEKANASNQKETTLTGKHNFLGGDLHRQNHFLGKSLHRQKPPDL